MGAAVVRLERDSPLVGSLSLLELSLGNKREAARDVRRGKVRVEGQGRIGRR